ncbi:hypothetical protein EMIT07CA2_60208 [Brevibacillus sp. IT-7CA2]
MFWMYKEENYRLTKLLTNNCKGIARGGEHFVMATYDKIRFSQTRRLSSGVMVLPEGWRYPVMCYLLVKVLPRK